ncbi:MAG TPA: hypothetical protein VGK67_04970 [Myxococcales bacterium]
MKLVVAAAVAAAVLVSGTAFAASPKQAPPRTETLTFERVVLEGNVVGPGLTPIYVKPSAKFANLLKTRGDFLPELERSVDGL